MLKPVEMYIYVYPGENKKLYKALTTVEWEFSESLYAFQTL